MWVFRNESSPALRDAERQYRELARALRENQETIETIARNPASPPAEHHSQLRNLNQRNLEILNDGRQITERMTGLLREHPEFDREDAETAAKMTLPILLSFFES